MTSRLTIVCCLLALGASLYAQQVSDLNDPVYRDLELWQARGLLKNLPPLRPYPVQIVQALLARVQTTGDAVDKERAAAYARALEGVANAHLLATAEARTDLGAAYYQLGVQLQVQGAWTPDIAYSGSLGGFAANGGVDSLLEEYNRPGLDIVYDAAVAPLGTSGLTPRISMTGSASFGSDSFYFQAGILRAGFGPVWGDSIVLSPTAPQAGQFSVVVRQDAFTLTMALLDVAATNNDGSGGPQPNKFLSFHSLEVYPLDWLTLGIFESVVWGGRFEPLYILPLPTVLFVAQGLVGYPDNSFVGLSAGVGLPENVRADFVLYVDDAAFNDLIRLNLNTMLVLAGQAEASWTPHLPWLETVSLGYTLVTPYAYSHIGAGGAGSPNYLNYTNNGQNMATSLQPDSDRIELRAMARPVPYLDLDVFARFIRHGNGSEGVTAGNGTIFDDGYTAGGVPTFTPGGGYILPPGILYYTRFLTQTTIEKTLQAGVNVRAQLQTSSGTFEGSVAYTFEYSWNYQLGSAGHLANYLSAGLGYRY